MAVTYSAEVCDRLRRQIDAAELERPARVNRYDAGQVLEYEVTGVCPARRARVTVEVEKFVGGGFAGQVYRVVVRSIEPASGAVAADSTIPGLHVGQAYAMKILVPPSQFAVRFRNFIYAVGFQAPFALQVNVAAARAGALWQKFIRRAAAIELGEGGAVCDILATFVDPRIGSCGEISEWVAGRNWRFEVDDRLRENHKAGRPEYQAKKRFMARFVQLLHEVGAPELARQYEWWTCKSQPNSMKRLDADGQADPAAGLTAVDFRAGLALLPMLPMSPGDVPLIVKGLTRGSLVQFDRGDVGKLRRYINRHADHFADMRDSLDELTANERIYRDSQIDVTHNHVRLLYEGGLWKRILASAVSGWHVRGMIDDHRAADLASSATRTLLFAVVGLLAGLAGAIALAGLLGILLGGAAWVTGWSFWRTALATGTTLLFGGLVISRLLRFGRSLWGREDLRRHYGRLCRDGDYFRRAVHAHAMEDIIGWHRAGRVSAERAEKLSRSLGRFMAHRLLLAWLPAGPHRMLSDQAYAWQRLADIVVRPARLYFNAAAREQWMRDMIDDGVRQRMLTEAEADNIRGRLGEPYIQKYLKALAVHVCTLPISEVIWVIVAAYVAARHGKTWGEAWALAITTFAVFQFIPISPGSLIRGLYVVWLVIRDRNYRDYKLALWLSFWKGIGYLAFPLQMAYSYPSIARFMAGRWATGAVHIVPVFGEHGALLEHAAFDLFYNWPLTLRRRMAERTALRAGRPTRWWPLPLAILGGWLLIAQLPSLRTITTGNTWRVHHSLPLSNSAGLLLAAGALSGFVVSRAAGGASLARRILLGLTCGGAIGLLQLAATLAWPYLGLDRTLGAPPFADHLGSTLMHLALPVFGTTVLAAMAAFVADVFRRPPRSQPHGQLME